MKKPVLTLLRTTPGLDDQALLRALILTGREILNFDDRLYSWHETPNFLHRAARKINRPALDALLNRTLVEQLKAAKPSHLIVFKCPSLRPETLKAAKRSGTRTVMVYPDLDPRVHGPGYLEAAALFDEFFHTKPNLTDFFRTRIHPRSRYIAPFYEPDWVSQPAKRPETGLVSFVGHHSPSKEAALKSFAACYKGHLRVIGDRWVPSMFRGSRAKVQTSPALYGRAVVELQRNSLCSLGLLMESLGHGVPGDEITSRTITVPAYGGLLLHPRTDGAERIFGRGSPLLFSDMSGAAQKAAELEKDLPGRFRLAKEQQVKAVRSGTNAAIFIRDRLCR